jgi:mannose-6-phosphate isomerase-like protein (cupin superfamily)
MPDGLGEYLLVKSNEETGGEYVEMEWILPPDAFTPPPHVHPSQAEEYQVLDGSFEVMLEGDWRTLRAGESASVPAGTNHTFRLLPGQSVRVRNFHRPGLRFDEFIERQHRFVTSARYKGIRRPSTAIAMAMAWREHRDMLVPSNPLLRGAVAGLARLGKLLGYT